MTISLLFGPIVAVPLTMLVVPLDCITASRAFREPVDEKDAPAAQAVEAT